MEARRDASPGGEMLIDELNVLENKVVQVLAGLIVCLLGYCCVWHFLCTLVSLGSRGSVEDYGDGGCE